MNPEYKRQFNEHHFTIAAPRYDLATAILSFGQDAAWKRQLIAACPSIRHPQCLDLACGTGDVTFLLAKKYPNGRIEGLDITQSMLSLAQDHNRFGHVTFVKKEMCPLDYPDASFDVITGGYALRNAPVLKDALEEIRRVLKPGGIGAFLDFSKPENKYLQILEYWILKLWGSLWGILLHGDPRIHGYIAASLKTYPDRRSLASCLNDLGFQILQRKRFFLGVTEIIIFRKSS